MNNDEENLNNSNIVENSIERNTIDNKLTNIDNNIEEENLTQEEHDENINSETKLNEAGKKEVRIEVDETVTEAHEKDRKKSKLMFLLIIVLPLLIISLLIVHAMRNNKEEVFFNEIKNAGIKYMAKDEQASLTYAFYTEKINEYYLFIEDLKNEGLITKDVIDPKTKENLNDSILYLHMENGELIYTFPYKDDIEKINVIHSAKKYTEEETVQYNALKNNEISRLTISTSELKNRGYIDFSLDKYKDTIIEITYEYNRLMFNFV